ITKRKQKEPPIWAALFENFYFTEIFLYFSTVPLIYKTLTGVFAFDFIVTILLKGCALAALYVTLTEPSSLGFIGVLVYFGTVQPQVDSTLLMIKGSVPIFL